jgi:predicted RNA-binding protein with TRAM domain
MFKERSFGGGSRGGFAPVSVGQEIDVKIEAVGQKGDGIAKEKGFVLFVPGTKENDEVRVRITKVLKNVGFAEVIGKSSGEPKSEQSSDSSESNNEGASQPESQSEDSYEEQASPEDSEDFGEEEQQE